MWTVYKIHISTVAVDNFRQMMCTVSVRRARERERRPWYSVCTDTHTRTQTWNHTGFIITHGEHPFLSPFKEMRLPVLVVCVSDSHAHQLVSENSALVQPVSRLTTHMYVGCFGTHPHWRKHRPTHTHTHDRHIHPHLHMKFSVHVYMLEIEASSAVTLTHSSHWSRTFSA